MCGRYSLKRCEAFDLDEFGVERPMPPLEPREQVFPAQEAPVVPNLRPRTVELFRWGLIPAWATDQAIGHRLINARAETLAQKPSFREPLRRRRCLVPADGFYEWLRQERGPKTRFLIRRKDGGVFAFAGLWDVWQPPEGPVVRSFTIITTAPNGLVAPIHDRMPVILFRDAWDEWLQPGLLAAADALRLLAPWAPDAFEAVPG
jgi:putative SOS response-associated peptidase YedK